MIDVETSLEPPLASQADETADDQPSVYVAASLIENDGTMRNSNVTVHGDPTDEQLADALIACLRGVAGNRSPGLAAAVDRRVR